MRRYVRALVLACFILGGFASGALAVLAGEGEAPRAAGALPAWVRPAVLAEGEDLAPVAADLPEGRTNFLLLGVDRRPVEDADTPALTDTLMILSVDTTARAAALLSLPRDLWLPMPLAPGRVITDRINSAYAYGDTLAYPGGGPALLKATIEYNFGIRINHFALVDFKAFEKFVDTIGGVDVDLAEALNDPSFPTGDYGRMAVALPKGKQHLTGEKALWLVRSRYQSSDFSRMQRQQQFLFAVRDQVLRADVALRIPALWLEFRDVVKTDVSLPELVGLAQLATSVPRDRIRNRTVDQEYIVRGAVPGEPFALTPNRGRIAQLVAELFADNPSDPRPWQQPPANANARPDARPGG